MIIENWTDDYVKFSDGSEITYDHNQDCCEYNYADFSVLDIFYSGEEFSDYRLEPIKYGVNLILVQDANHKYGWSPRDKAIYIPFYSEQNGYYTDDVCLVVKGKSEVIVGPSEGYCILDCNDFTEKNVKDEIDSGYLDHHNAIFCNVCNSVMLCKTVADLDKTLKYHLHKEHTKSVMDDSRLSFSKKAIPLTATRLEAKGPFRYYLIEENTQNEVDAEKHFSQVIDEVNGIVAKHAGAKASDIPPFLIGYAIATDQLALIDEFLKDGTETSTE